MMIWERILGQPEVATRLQAVVQSKEASHAFLFWGREGCGKKNTARVFAAALNCSEGGCGTCLSCRKVLGGIHPDVYEIEPEGNFLTIEQIRSLQHWAHLKPSEGRTKSFIIDEADRMTEPAANALLKTLEEPPMSCLFVLVTSQPENLLPTITSRCQLVRFNSISLDKMKELLMKEKGLDARTAEIFSRASGGVLGRTLTLVESDRARKVREMILSFLFQLDRLEVADLLEKSEEMLLAVKDPVSELKESQEQELSQVVEIALDSRHASHLKRTFTQRHKRELSRREHSGMENIFDLFSSWYADLLRLKQGLDQGGLINIDHYDQLRAKSEVLEEAKILEALDAIRHGREMFKRNVSSSLALEATLLRLGDLAR